MKLQLVATCMFGLERLVGQEIDALGGKRTETMDGRIYFEGDERTLVRANFRLRCAERVLILMGRFPAASFEELFEGTKALPWEEWIGKNDAFPVIGHAIKSKLFSVPDCQKIIKKAIVNRLSSQYGIGWFPETGATVRVEFFLFKDTAALMIDSSGIALHKRGYRPQSGVAPLRETLAAGLVLSSHPREDTLVWDPMCGSGTIAVEAAMIHAGIAPGISRSFAAQSFPAIPAALWQEEREIAKAEIKPANGETVWASDIDAEVLSVAKENATRAGVKDRIRFFVADARTIEKPDRRGTVICNPPYGERLMTPAEVEELYRAVGKNFARFDPWQIYIITSHPQFEKLYGRRADKILRQYNGMIPCFLYEFFKPKR